MSKEKCWFSLGGGSNCRASELESQLRDAVALLKTYHFALKQYEIMSPTRLDEHEFYISIAKKALSAPLPESLKGLL